ncbi:alanine/glycine:cation symporter family protein [uncultured Rubinisphaera sp.]|uniref:alanine/glycine:cation symporter family protein n=1 Tax=uncultured Rubinisphaera sp. TaxID=1678686 RepID=UPI0030D747A8
MNKQALAIDNFVKPLAELFNTIVFWPISIIGIEVPIVVLFLFSAGVYFTIYLGFPAATALPRALRIVFGWESTGNNAGEVSHFQALATALAGTVGIGNIANVAVAISIGGPGVIFWMITAGFLGTSSKLMECTLGVRFRTEYEDGSVSGGPMYFLRDGLGLINKKILGKVLGASYAVCLLFATLGSGNMFQSNQAYRQVVNLTGGLSESWLADKGWLFGLVMAICLSLVIVGGIKSIARVTEKLVPFMAIIYLLLAIIVILANYEAIPYALQVIFTGAFQPMGAVGGAVGVAIMGIQRSVFSNEAGIGTASIAHSAVRTDYPASEGIVSLLEPIIDTVVICTITGMVIITANYETPDLLSGQLSGIELTSQAFKKTFSFAPFIVSIAAVLFAFSTLISWSYYGLKAWSYLFGKSFWGELLYKFIFCAAAVLGCTITLNNVLLFSDAMVFIIAVPNLIGLIVLGPIVKEELKRFSSSGTPDSNQSNQSIENETK